MDSSKKKTSLFSTLASIEENDSRAALARVNNPTHQLQQSKAASDQTKISSSLLELRILIQRCASESGNSSANSRETSKIQDGVDALLENLLVARRQLMNEEDGEKVNYTQLIQNKHDSDNEDKDSDESFSSSDDEQKLESQLQVEYDALKSQWKVILNKHHSLHSGIAFSSKFTGKAFDVSFWEQVQSGMEHDRFKQQSSASKSGDDEFAFDDSKLYQQLLKDVIATSSGSASSNTKTGMPIDPAVEAAERLKRVMRKKPGYCDLGALLTKKRKVENNVDRRASKARKIRYNIVPKLVNFTFPMNRPEPMIKEDVWFKSLFGGAGFRTAP